MKFNIRRVVPAPVSRKIAITALKAQKNSPSILFGVGVVGVVGATVLACRATLKVTHVLDEHDKTLVDLDSMTISPAYTEKDLKHDKTVLYVNTSVKLVKLYGPAFVLGVTSIAALAGSHRILSKRNAALGAAYAGVEKAFQTYRDRVVAEYGEEKDAEFRYGVEERTIVEDTKKGPVTKTVKKFGDLGASPYARIFDGTTSANFTHNYPEGNRVFLEVQEEYANKRLIADGYLMLNDVYKALGLEKSTAGAVVGWVYNPERFGMTGDRRVSFGIGDWPSAQDFIHGSEGAILLDFNVDGDVHQLIDKI